jgi:hypothetical protein
MFACLSARLLIVAICPDGPDPTRRTQPSNAMAHKVLTDGAATFTKRDFR